MDALLDRFRTFWDGLLTTAKGRMLAGAGPRARRDLVALAARADHHASNEVALSSESEEIRAVLASIEENRAALALQEDARKSAETRYQEHHAAARKLHRDRRSSKYQLSLFEVTEQPEKTEGASHRLRDPRRYQRGRSDRRMNLLNGIVTSAHPVAIDHIQIEHPQSGDKYRLKLGVLTFDRKVMKPAAQARCSRDKQGGCRMKWAIATGDASQENRQRYLLWAGYVFFFFFASSRSRT